MGAHGAGIAKTASASQSAQPSQPLRILVADDNPMNQRVATSLLEKRGHSVAIADNGLRVLEMLDRNRFDVILMDCQMPEMDGFETTVAIRKREESADGHRIPIIALTAQADGSDQQRCLQAGMDAYASKPFDARRLLGLIEQLCQGRTAEMIPSQL
jgi:CheY-like chemotaxis protein